MNIFKSIGAVLAGFITVFILSLLTDVVLQERDVFPPQTEPGAYSWWMLLLALIYRSTYTVAGGYVTAALAPNRPMRLVIILGIIGIVAGTIGMIVGWSLSHHWYPIALVIVVLPCMWLGGKLERI